ncbi:Uncharacterized protein Fot_52262 [Forsythia ovata]|uniref:NAC domain-containing protein n=1 Tax=Forsythia ovata TaxID=205694 RepID=A0ABD1PP10_9LAMI
MELDDWVLCKIYNTNEKKSNNNSTKRKRDNDRYQEIQETRNQDVAEQEIEPTARRSSKNVEQEGFWDLNKIEAMLMSDSSLEIEPTAGGSTTNVEQDYSWETMSMPVSFVGIGEDNSGIPEMVDSWVQLLEGLITPKRFRPSQ